MTRRERRRQPVTIEELLAPDRVWVTPCGCWLWLGGDDGYGDEHMDFDQEQPQRPAMPVCEPILAPGELEEDLVI